jgi:HAD superfamily hydrolase (TIGR01509 family)
MIKGVVFDLDGVYFRNGKRNFIKNISSRYGVDIELVRKVFLRSEQMKRYKKGEMQGYEFWKYAIEKWGIESAPEQILETMKQGYEINQLAVDVIRRLRESGIKSIICSNNFRERIEVLNQRFGFLKDFDYVILSYEHGILKPELFEKAPEKTGFKPEEIAILDDGKEIIEEAGNMGFMAIFCEDQDRIEEYLEKIGINI